MFTCPNDSPLFLRGLVLLLGSLSGLVSIDGKSPQNGILNCHGAKLPVSYGTLCTRELVLVTDMTDVRASGRRKADRGDNFLAKKERTG